MVLELESLAGGVGWGGTHRLRDKYQTLKPPIPSTPYTRHEGSQAAYCVARPWQKMALHASLSSLDDATSAKVMSAAGGSFGPIPQKTVFIPTLLYGLDTLTLTDKYRSRIDAYYTRFFHNDS